MVEYEYIHADIREECLGDFSLLVFVPEAAMELCRRTNWYKSRNSLRYLGHCKLPVSPWMKGGPSGARHRCRLGRKMMEIILRFENSLLRVWFRRILYERKNKKWKNIVKYHIEPSKNDTKEWERWCQRELVGKCTPVLVCAWSKNGPSSIFV